MKINRGKVTHLGQTTSALLGAPPAGDGALLTLILRARGSHTDGLDELVHVHFSPQLDHSDVVTQRARVPVFFLWGKNKFLFEKAYFTFTRINVKNQVSIVKDTLVTMGIEA